MKQAKQRVIYNNYDLWKDYADDVKENLSDEATENEIWEEIYFQDEINWSDEHEQLKTFFNNSGVWLIRGRVGRWDGQHAAGHVFTDFDEMFYTAIQDCQYWKIWDENGHFYLKCSHHDGTNFFEIKKLTGKAVDFLENWKYNDDPRTEREVHNVVWYCNLFSALPHFAHNVYGCKKQAYKKKGVNSNE